MIDMAFFTAQVSDPAEYCARMVDTADVYVGLIGARYGSLVRGRPEVSYSELEFQAATDRGLPRLVFLLPGDADGRGRSEASCADIRQTAFRGRLQSAGLTTAQVATPAELETRLYQALVELPDEGAGRMAASGNVARMLAHLAQLGADDRRGAGLGLPRPIPAPGRPRRRSRRAA